MRNRKRRARPGTRLTGEIAGQMSGLQAAVADTVLGNRVAYAEALGTGRGVAEMPRAAAAAAEVEALGAEIDRILG